MKQEMDVGGRFDFGLRPPAQRDTYLQPFPRWKGLVACEG